MNKIIGGILGIGIAIVIVLFFVLVLRIIFPEPDYGACEPSFRFKEPVNLTDEEAEAIRECYDQNDALRLDRERKTFLGAVIIGILLIIAILPILGMANIAAGVGAAGISLIVYGFMVGWRSSGDTIKLILLFISAALLIGIASYLNIRSRKNIATKRRKKS